MNNKYLIVIFIASMFIVGCNYKDASEKLEKVSEISAVGKSYAEKVSFIPAAQPYASATGALLGGISVITTGLAAFFRSKSKKQESSLKVVLSAVDDIPEIGKKITADTVSAGVSEIVEKAYRSL